MEIMELSLPASNPLVHAYLTDPLNMKIFFDYHPHHRDVFQKRYEKLKVRNFEREKLVHYLFQYHKRFDQADLSLQNIEKLKDPKSVVVAGGQQAGLLTGPLYTIHKIISILTLAKQLQEQLGVPVIPLFWIAGEDHDFEEINHVYVYQNERIQKKAISQVPFKKQMVSNIEIDKSKCRRWFKEIIETYGETEHTNLILNILEELLDRSRTYVEFFEQIVMTLFHNSGLVLLNSADKGLRKLEKSHFRKILHQNEKIYEAVEKQQQLLRQNSFQPTIEMKQHSANIFIHYDDERFLLLRDQNKFVIPEIDLKLTKEELEERLEHSPNSFSNNVITRPIMQELLLPTLAFIAGPGEIAYWAELKGAFHVCDLDMPPVIPRLNMTILERHIETDIEELNLSLDEIFHQKIKQLKENWLREKEPLHFEPLVEEAKEKIEQIHSQLREAALEIDKSLEPLLKKNAYFIESQLSFIQHAVKKKVNEKFEAELNKFKRIECSLAPNGLLQERVWNIFYYLNKYGLDFLKLLQQETYTFNGKHKVVKI
ncbi:bacillithiol biosynthesis cysteine-adding enzyme BshC [Aeribacillus alveayuensis]|uniref:Putative cysteine ligase BshC n=1 Tax=Aeribacillus alveayuensis TaxID=279215 RepID=A0ABT9VL84_9BACI|nr:bacillithiol biosynthesis cysteine-adding enzyme BshC [Bacillus alveayuensis]